MRQPGECPTKVEGRARLGGVKRWSFVTGAVLCAGLVGGVVSPVWAASSPGGEAGDVQLGSFALGDGLEGTIGELDGSFGFTLSAGGMQLAWDSRAAAADPVGLGTGWSFGLARLRVDGGVWVHPASGGAFAMSATSPTGLAGYPGSDVRFAAAAPGAVVPARADGSVGETPYAYVLHELGGVSTYFDAAGYPLAKLVVEGDRIDWRWAPGEAGQLVAVVGADGTVTALDWSDPARVTIVPGSNVTDPADGSGAGGRWQVELDGGRVSAVADPVGARTMIAYGDQALVERISTPAGASTVVEWRSSLDAVARVDRVRVVDDVSGRQLSERRWAVEGQISPSGWPAVSGPVDLASDGAAAAALEFETSLSDGKTRIGSRVAGSSSGAQRIMARAVSVTSGSGEHVVQEHAYAYAERAETPGAPGAPALDAKPTSVTTTHHDRSGGTRSVTESYEFDELGRMVSRTTTDGTTTRRAYDLEVPAGRALPIGLVTEETTTAPDGLVTSTRYELRGDRAVAEATELWSGREGGELVRTDRVERDVEDGFVTELRVFPGGNATAEPVVTRWSRQLDLPRGTKRVVQTVAAGTPVESSAESVASLVHGGTLTESDVLGNATVARYDEAGRQMSVEDAAGRTVERTYRTRQADGVNAVTVADDRGVEMTETRDALGRVVQRSDNIAPSGRAVAGHERVFETRDHERPGVERVTDAWGRSTTTEHDVFGRVQRVTLANGLQQVAEFDDVAGTTTTGVSLTGDLADAEFTSTTTFDTAGRPTATAGSRADGAVVPETSTEFDGLGRQLRATTGSRSTAIEYDVFGHAVSTKVEPATDAEGVVEAAEVEAERRYDPFGVSLEKTLRSGDETHAGPRRELDELGRVVSQTDQRGVRERTTYTADGLVDEVVSDTGRVTSHSYDPQTRAIVGMRVSSPHGATVETSFRYDEAGRLIAVYDPADEAGTIIRYETDDFGNPTRTTYPDGTEVRHEYDPHGRKTASIDADGNRTAFTYDEEDGALVAAMQTDREGAPVSGVRYEYDELGRVSSVVRENGVRTAYTFTSAAQVASEVTTGPDGTVSEREYAYSPGGLLTSRVDRVAGDDGAMLATRTAYEYDTLDRLVRSSVREGDTAQGRVLTQAEYEPTVVGDLASETVTTDPDTPEAVASTRRFEYSAVGELTAIVTDGERRTQEFDAEGSLLASAAGGRYEYDAAGRLIARTTADEVRIETSYWADGSRKDQSTETGTTRFYWDGDRLINEVHEAAGEHGTASYLIGANRHARSVRTEGGAASTSYYGTDRHGNVTDLTDATGRVTSAYAYTDYGVTTVTGDQAAVAAQPAGIGELGYNPFQYAGEYTHRDGTQPLGPRTYDPAQARFLSMDDAPLANLYAFGDLNPITNVDPSGRQAQVDWNHLGPLIAGFVVAVAAGMFFAFSGGASGVLGFVGGVLAGGDAALAGFELARGLGKVQWTDPKAMEIAAYGLAAVSFGMGIGAIGAKLVARWGTKAPVEIVDETTDLLNESRIPEQTSIEIVSGVKQESMRRNAHLSSIDRAALMLAVGIDGSVSDAKFTLHVTDIVTNISHAERVHGRMMSTKYFAKGANQVAAIRKIDAKVMSYIHKANEALSKADVQLTYLKEIRQVDRAVDPLKQARRALTDAFTPGKVFTRPLDGFEPDSQGVRFVSGVGSPLNLDAPAPPIPPSGANPLDGDKIVTGSF